MLGSEHEALAAKLEQAREEARETQERCTELAGTFKGKKTAILEKAREVKQEATEMREAYLGGEEDPLDGFEFLTMAEAGEVGHWSIVAKINEKAGQCRAAQADRLGAADPATPPAGGARRLAEARGRRGPRTKRPPKEDSPVELAPGRIWSVPGHRWANSAARGSPSSAARTRRRC